MEIIGFVEKSKGGYDRKDLPSPREAVTAMIGWPALVVGARAMEEDAVDAVVVVAGEEGASSACSRRHSIEWWRTRAWPRMGYTLGPSSFIAEEHRAVRSMGSRSTDTNQQCRRTPRCSSAMKLEYRLEALIMVAEKEGACVASWEEGSRVTSPF